MQLGTKLLIVSCGSRNKSLRLMRGFGRGEKIQNKMMYISLTERVNYSVCAFRDTHAVISGGYRIDTCEIFSEKTESVKRFPPMSRDRHSHASTNLGNYIYAFGGHSYLDESLLSSVEFINVQLVIGGDPDECWRELRTSGDVIHPRSHAILVPLGRETLLVLGGGHVNASYSYSDGFELNVKTGVVKQCIENDESFKFLAWP